MASHPLCRDDCSSIVFRRLFVIGVKMVSHLFLASAEGIDSHQWVVKRIRNPEGAATQVWPFPCSMALYI